MMTWKGEYAYKQLFLLACLPAGVIAGLLWNTFGSVVPFTFGASLSLLSALILAFGLPQGE